MNATQLTPAPPRSQRVALLSAAGLALALALSACTTPSSGPASGPAPTTAAKPAVAAGGLVAQQATVDLGRVPFDRSVEARYTLTNTGDRPIRLTAPPQVKTLEGC